MIFRKKQDAAVQQTAAGEAKPAAKGGKAAAFFRKNWKWMVPVVCVAVLGGWFILRPDKAQNANTDINYVQVSPSKRDVSNTLSGTGTLNPANTYNVKSLVAGKVLTSSFEEGDIVEEGTVLYTVDSSDATTKAEQASIALQQAQRSYDKTADRQYVRAEVAGVVSALKVAKGDEVTSGQEVAVIRDSSKMVLRLEFPAADAATFSVGQSAEVTLDGTFEMLTGTVTAVTGTDALSTGNLLTRTVTIAVRNAGGLTTHPDCPCRRYRDGHQCAGRRSRKQGRYRAADQRRGPDRGHPVCRREPAQRRAEHGQSAGGHEQLHHHLAHQRYHY